MRPDLPPPPPEDFARIEALFERLVDAEAGERVQVLQDTCGDRPDLALEVEALLAAHDRNDQAGGDRDAKDAHGIGVTVGAYRLVEKIGEGGMGVVYRAERADGAFTHRVAMKLTRPHQLSDDGHRRFALERQVLASLRHPNIVQLFDGGTLPDGGAFFVMELVDGVPITRYCALRRMGLGERVRLLRDVCDAVQHAHQHGVVHRDLKPANVLVTEGGVPKVLDFGVAKLLDQPASAESTVSVLSVPLTPNYASPEQLRGLTVTTASDVYGLGVLLYEIVSGVRPYDTVDQPLDRVIDIVVHQTPARPSAADGTGGEPLPYPRRALRGDLDAIVLKALGKTPADRYQSASELAADLSRWLDGQPVLAREPSAAYLLRRLATRHRVAVVAVGVALTTIVVASGVAWSQRQVARRAQARAERRFNDVRDIARKVVFDYQAALRELSAASELRARMLADSLRYLDALAEDGTTSPGLQLEIARGYINISEVQGAVRNMSLGDREAAISSLRKAEVLLADLVARNPRFGQARFSLAAMGCYYARVEPERRAVHATRCVAALEPLAAEEPSNGLVHLTLGQAHLRLAESGLEDHAGRAIEILSRVGRESGEGRAAAGQLGLAHRILGWSLLERGEARLALEHGEASAAVLEGLAEGGDASARRTEYSFTLQLIGRSALALNDRQRARMNLEEGLRVLQTAYRENPRDAFIQDRLLVAYQYLAESLEEMEAPREAARRYREAVTLMPSLATRVNSEHREAMQAALYAGHARLGFPTPPCDLVRRAAEWLSMALQRGPVEQVYLRHADWVRATAARCPA